MSLGRRITELRLSKGESLQNVADAVGVSKAHIWELEKGRADNPSMNLVMRLADHFNVKVAYLVGEDPDAKDADARLASMFRKAHSLSASSQIVISDMIEVMLHREGNGDEA